MINCTRKIPIQHVRSLSARYIAPHQIGISVGGRTIHYFTNPIKKKRVNVIHNVAIRKFSKKDEFMFILLRLAVRGLGKLAGIFWRSGVLKYFSFRTKLLMVGTPVALGVGIFLYSAERVPYSNRLHYLWLDRATELELSEEGRNSIFESSKGKFLSEGEEICKITEKVVHNLLQVCEDDGIITAKQRASFSLYMIKSNIPNAFVLPDGSIFVYTGILPIAETEGGLACILGHEISHALAHHASEKIGILKMLILLYEFIQGFTEYRPYGLTGKIFTFLAITMFQIGVPLAHSRKMESEADRIGLQLAAKAGYDPDQAAALWERMMAFEHRMSNNRKVPPPTVVTTEGQGKGEEGKKKRLNKQDDNKQQEEVEIVEEEEEEVFIEDRWTAASVWNYWIGGNSGGNKKAVQKVSSASAAGSPQALSATTDKTSSVSSPASSALVTPVVPVATKTPSTTSTTTPSHPHHTHHHHHHTPTVPSTTTTTTTSTTTSTTAGTTALTTSERVTELFSTHPCHARRIDDLRKYAAVVRPDYQLATDRLRMLNQPTPSSTRYLPYEGVKKRADTPFDYDYGWEEGDWQSALVANHASALMIGQEGDAIKAFLKSIGRLDVPWGGK